MPQPVQPEPLPPPQIIQAPTPPPVPTQVDAAVVSAKQNQINKANLADGRMSTVLTGPQGLEDSLTSNAKGKTLLGA